MTQSVTHQKRMQNRLLAKNLLMDSEDISYDDMNQSYDGLMVNPNTPIDESDSTS